MPEVITRFLADGTYADGAIENSGPIDIGDDIRLLWVVYSRGRWRGMPNQTVLRWTMGLRFDGGEWIPHFDGGKTDGGIDRDENGDKINLSWWRMTLPDGINRQVRIRTFILQADLETWGELRTRTNRDDA